MNVRFKSGILFIESQPFPVPSYHLRDLRSAQKKVNFCFEVRLRLRIPFIKNKHFPFSSYHLKDQSSAQKKVGLIFEGAFEI